MTNKAKARAYYQSVNAYDAPAIESMVKEGYIQHNPFLPTGRAAFVALLPELRLQRARIENVRLFADGCFVVMHHEWKNAAVFGNAEMLAFHVIRFGASGLIAEHWNVMAPKAGLNPAGRSQTDGETVVQPGDAARNKAVVRKLFEDWMTAGEQGLEEAWSIAFRPNFRQHLPRLGDGLTGLAAARRRGGLPERYLRQHQVLGEGDFVLSIAEAEIGGHAHACYDLFRLEGGWIVEQWGIHQSVPAAGVRNSNGMFGFPGEA